MRDIDSIGCRARKDLRRAMKMYVLVNKRVNMTIKFHNSITQIYHGTERGEDVLETNQIKTHTLKQGPLKSNAIFHNV